MTWHTVAVEALRVVVTLALAAGVVMGAVDPQCVDLGALTGVVLPALAP